MTESDRDGRQSAFAKAQRLGAKAGDDVEFWNWAVALTKRELIEIILANVSAKHARAIYRQLEKEGKI